jgi:DNA-binding transcriptional LysR family regulator
MELLHLRVLREVARRGSISAAADALDYTQPAVSRQLAMLERQAGQSLFERTPRGARLTPSGEILLRHAEDILGRVDAAQAEMETISALRGGQVRVCAFPSTVASFVPAGLRAFGDLHPDVRVRFELAEAAPAQELLARGAVDVAVTSLGSAREAPPGFDVHPLIDDPFLVAMASDHPLADLAEVPIAALAGEPMVLDSPVACPDCEVMLTACEAEGFTPNREYLVDDYGAALGLVAAGLAVAMIPQLAVDRGRDDVVLRPLDTHLVRPIVAMTLATQSSSPLHDALVGALHDAAGPYRAAAAASWVAGMPADA